MAMVDGGVERTFNVVVEFCVEIVIEIKPGASSSSTAEDRSVSLCFRVWTVKIRLRYLHTPNEAAMDCKSTAGIVVSYVVHIVYYNVN